MKQRYHTKIRPVGSKDQRVKMLFRQIDRLALTLNDVSIKSGVDAATLSNWRTGKTSPRLDLFISVCDAVGLECQLELKL